ncbi:MAG: hypothetical protein MJ252_08925, partial [archaeon]|nr:hypothetical protein [archaeon]
FYYLFIYLYFIYFIMESFSLGNIFHWLGFKVASHPILVITIPTILLGFLLSGLVFMDFEVRNIKIK